MNHAETIRTRIGSAHEKLEINEKGSARRFRALFRVVRVFRGPKKTRLMRFHLSVNIQTLAPNATRLLKTFPL
jgi:hypothetical protein